MSNTVRSSLTDMSQNPVTSAPAAQRIDTKPFKALKRFLKLAITTRNYTEVISSKSGVAVPPEVEFDRGLAAKAEGLAHLEVGILNDLTSRGKPALELYQQFGCSSAVENTGTVILYHRKQLARLSSALIIGLNLSGLSTQKDILDLGMMDAACWFSNVPSLAKQFGAWPLAALQDIPELPKAVSGWNYEYLFGSKVRRLIRGRVLSPGRNKERQSFLFGELFLRLKRSALEVSPAFVEESLKKHAAEISIPDPPREEAAARARLPVSEYQRIEKYIMLITDEIFSDCGFGICESGIRLGQPLPSGKASLRTDPTGSPIKSSGSRGNGGQACATQIENVGQSQKVIMVTDEVEGPNGTFLTQRPEPFGPPDEVSDYFVSDQPLPRASTPNLDVPRTSTTAGGDLFLQYATTHKGPIATEAVAVLEPFKVRVITKGDGIPYLKSKALQELLTERMKTCSISHFFPSLRGNLVDSDISKHLDMDEGWEVLSGDYTGATDMLRKDLSEYTLRGILHYVKTAPWAYRRDVDEILRKSLTEHEIYYSLFGTLEGNVFWSATQRRGQLMGSFLSFPVLNIINLAVNLAYLEFKGQIHDHRDSFGNPVEFVGIRFWTEAPLIVNGDDTLAAGPFGTFSQDWAEYVSLAGFIKSLGKNYISKSFCTINSQLYLIHNDGLNERSILTLTQCPRVERFYTDRWCVEFDPPWVRAEKRRLLKEAFVNMERGLKGLKPIVKKVKAEAKTNATNAGGHLGARGRQTGDVYFEHNPGGLSDLLWEMMPTVQEELQPLAIRVFVNLRRADLKKTGLPWFVDKALGGLGIPAFPQLCDLSTRDRVTQSYLLGKARRLGKLQIPPLPEQGTLRPGDTFRSTAERKFLKGMGWIQYPFIDPPAHLIKLHDERPQPKLSTLGLLLLGVEPVDRAFFRGVASVQKYTATASSRAAKESRTPAPTGRRVRLLWVPERSAEMAAFKVWNSLSAKLGQNVEDVSPDVLTGGSLIAVAGGE